MTAYNRRRLAAEITALAQPSPSTTAHGRKLQDLAEWLIGEIPGCKIELRNKHDAANTEEKDLWFSQIAHESRLPFTDVLVPVECKNEDSKASAAEVREFGSKILKSGGRDGLLISRAGLAGQRLTSAHAAISEQLSSGVRIVVLCAQDLAVLRSSDQFVELLVARHTELRTEQTYISI